MSKDLSCLPDEIVINEIIPKMSLKSLMNLRSTDRRMRDLVNGYFLKHQKEPTWNPKDNILYIKRYEGTLFINTDQVFSEEVCPFDIERWFFKSTVIKFNDMIIYYSKGIGWILLEESIHHSYRKIKINELAEFLMTFLIGVEVENWNDYEIHFYSDGYMLGGYNFFFDSDDQEFIESAESDEFEIEQKTLKRWIQKMIAREACISVIQ